MNRIRAILFHVSVICGIICIAGRVLDWYNPYMNFGGHVTGFLITFCVSIIFGGVLEFHEIYKGYMDRKRYGRQKFRIHAGV